MDKNGEIDLEFQKKKRDDRHNNYENKKEDSY